MGCRTVCLRVGLFLQTLCSCAFAAGGTQGCFTGSPVPLGRGLGRATIPAACAGADMQVRCEQRRGAQGETVAQSIWFLACSKGRTSVPQFKPDYKVTVSFKIRGRDYMADFLHVLPMWPLVGKIHFSIRYDV